MSLQPQPGPQTDFLSADADIVVYGGAAGGGKTWALLAEAQRYTNIKGFGGVVFRRTFPQITGEGQLWDAAQEMYAPLGARFRHSNLQAIFPCGARITFAHLQHEKNKQDWMGSQLAFIGWDELTHFTKSQFTYLLSRNRTMCGIRPYVRATCNPDAGSWVKDFLAPWVDRNSKIKAESSEVLFLDRQGGGFKYYKQDDPEAVAIAEMDPQRLKTVSFIAANVYDNEILLRHNPGYLANLKALDEIDRRRLLEGDWDVQEGDKLLNPEHFDIYEDRDIPWDHIDYKVRYWDLAATTKKEHKNAAHTAGVLMGLDNRTRICYILDVRRVRFSPTDVERLVTRTAEEDGVEVEIVMEQEPGSSGKKVIQDYSRLLLGYNFRGDRPTGDKVTRARPLATAASHGNIKLRKGAWNKEFLDEARNYPLRFCDQIDAASGAFTELANYRPFAIVSV